MFGVALAIMRHLGDLLHRHLLTLVLSVTGARYLFSRLGDALWSGGFDMSFAADALSFLVVLVSALYGLFQWLTETPEDERQKNINRALEMVAEKQAREVEITDEGKVRVIWRLRDENVDEGVIEEVEETIEEVQANV